MNIKKLNEEIESLLGKQNNRPNLASFTFKNYLNPDGQNYKGRETYSSTLKSVLEEMERLYNKVKSNYAGGTTAQEQFKNHCENIWKHATVRDSLSLNSSTVKKQPGLASAIKALHDYQQNLINDLAHLNKWDGKEWINELNEEIEQELSSNNPILDRIKQEYPENIEEDLTKLYKDLVIISLEDVLRPEELDNYIDSMKISKRVTHWPNCSYMDYSIFGLYGEDRVISARISVQANVNGKNSTDIDIRSGFTRNPIGRIENHYTFNPDFIFKDTMEIMMELSSEMELARKQSLKADQAYMDYVERTGDLS